MVDRLEFGRLTITKEAQALSSFASTLDRSFVAVCEMIEQCRGTVLTTGMGKSGLVARKWAATLCGTGTRSYYISPAEARHGDLGIIRSDDLLIALSLSGETEELGPILDFARQTGIVSVAVTRDVHSSVALCASLVISVDVAEEACPLGLAPTSSTTVMMALGDALAVTVMKMRGFSERDFARLHPGGSLGRRLWLRVSELMHSGDALPIVALEADLKQVLLTMTEKRLGLAVVADAEQLHGVITDGDLRRHFQQRPFDETLTAKSLMTSNPHTIPDDALAVEARKIMEAQKIQHLLAVRGGKCVGVIAFHDLLGAKVI